MGGGGGGGGGGGAGPPQYFTLETLLIFIRAAQIAASQCVLRSAPPKWNCFLRLCMLAWEKKAKIEGICKHLYSFSQHFYYTWSVIYTYGKTLYSLH